MGFEQLPPHFDDHFYCSPDPKSYHYCITVKLRTWRREGGIPSMKVEGGVRAPRRPAEG